MSTPKSNITPLWRNDPSYPVRLLDLCDPPNPLYIYGETALLHQPMIAIVGSRAASPEGANNARYFAHALSEAGFLIVSGMARGVDGAAHWRALGPSKDRGHPSGLWNWAGHHLPTRAPLSG